MWLQNHWTPAFAGVTTFTGVSNIEMEKGGNYVKGHSVGETDDWRQIRTAGTAGQAAWPSNNTHINQRISGKNTP
jgi:hypothetical protein